MNEEMTMEQMAAHNEQMIAVVDQASGEASAPQVEVPVLPSDAQASEGADDVALPEGMDVKQLIEHYNQSLANPQEKPEGEAEVEVEEGEMNEFEQRALDAERTLLEREVYESAGGKEEYTKMMNWGAGALTEQQIELYNMAVNSGTPEQARAAVEFVQLAYGGSKTKTHGSQGQLNFGSAQGANDSAVYTSEAEMYRDMQSPKYHSDPVFRGQVEQKVARTMSTR